MINLVLYLQGLFMLLCIDEKNVDKFHILGCVIVNTLSCISTECAAGAVIRNFEVQPGYVKKKSTAPNPQQPAVLPFLVQNANSIRGMESRNRLRPTRIHLQRNLCRRLSNDFTAQRVSCCACLSLTLRPHFVISMLDCMLVGSVSSLFLNLGLNVKPKARAKTF